MAMTTYSDAPVSPEFRKLQEAQGDVRTVGAISVVSKWAMACKNDINKRKGVISTLLGKAFDADATIRVEIRGRFQRVRQSGSILAVLSRVIEALVGALETTVKVCPRPREEGHDTPSMASGRRVTPANKRRVRAHPPRDARARLQGPSLIAGRAATRGGERRRRRLSLREDAVRWPRINWKEAPLRIGEGKKALKEGLALAMQQRALKDERSTGITHRKSDRDLCKPVRRSRSLLPCVIPVERSFVSAEITVTSPMRDPCRGLLPQGTLLHCQSESLLKIFLFFTHPKWCLFQVFQLILGHLTAPSLKLKRLRRLSPPLVQLSD